MEEINHIIQFQNDTYINRNFFDLLRVSDTTEFSNIIKIIGLYLIIILLSYYENCLFLNSQPSQKIPVIENNTKLSPEKEFINKEMKFFEKIYEKKEGFDPNENMDEEFYNLELYKETIKTENSDFEKKWRSKILNVYTPRGNISMYYDVYKMGFAYYSESSFLPYEILNAVAMRYVRNFRCRDLFMDNKITPLNTETPLIKLRKEEQTKEKEKTAQMNSVQPINKDRLKNGPFAKLKNYKLEENPNKKNKENTNTPTIQTASNLIYNVNLFIHMGKHANFSFIQRIPKKKVFVGMKSKFSDLFDKEHEVQTENMNYKAFKDAMAKRQKIE